MEVRAEVELLKKIKYALSEINIWNKNQEKENDTK